MGKVVVSISITPDGFVDGQNVIVDAGLFDFVQSLMADAEFVAFGRNTFEMFQERWPPRLKDENVPDWMREMARSLHNIPKVVFSSTLKNTTWNNSTTIDQLTLDYIKTFKQNRKGTLLTFGSIGLIESLTKMNVVDDYYFNVMPVLPGKGDVRFFSKLNLSATLPLKYVASQGLASGAHVIHYKNEFAIR